MLQHGSLPLTGDLTARGGLSDVRADEAERETLRRSLHGHAATAEELAGRPISYADAEAAMIAGFGEALALDLAPGELTDAERTWAAELVRDRYGNAEWTVRV